MNIQIKLKLNIRVKKGRRNVFKIAFDKVIVPTHVAVGTVKLLFLVLLHTSVFLRSIFPTFQGMHFSVVKAVQAEEVMQREVVYASRESWNIVTAYKLGKGKVDPSEIKAYALEQKYIKLGGIYYYPNVRPYLPIIDKVLREKGLDQDALFVQAMFYVGQHESHWNSGSVSGSKYGGEHPTGLFQFLPSTFRSVSGGYIYNAEDQIRAFVTMAERGRLHEFGTLYIPTLSPNVKAYALGFRG